MLKRLIQAYKKIKADEEKSRIEKSADSILYDELTLELIAKMARDCGRCFEIIRPGDGVAIRFYEQGFAPVREDNSKEVW